MERLFIDGKALAERGLWLGDGSYKNVLQWPQIKAVQATDWAESDGVEVDLSAPCLDSSSMQINFVGSYEDFSALISELTAKASHNFYFPELGLTKHLRLDTSSLKLSARLGAYSLTFIEDSLSAPFAVPSELSGFHDTGIELDGGDLRLFGVSVLQGTYQSLLSFPATKKRLVTKSAYADGQIYDAEGSVKMAGSDITLRLLIRNKDAPSCLAEYYRLLYQLTAPQLREISLPSHQIAFNCYYKASSVGRICSHLVSGLWGIAFDVTMAVVSKEAGEQVILTTDDGVWLESDYNNILTSRQ